MRCSECALDISSINFRGIVLYCVSDMYYNDHTSLLKFANYFIEILGTGSLASPKISDNRSPTSWKISSFMRDANNIYYTRWYKMLDNRSKDDETTASHHMQYQIRE